MEIKMKKGKKNELFNFGKGWGTIIFCLLMFWFYAGMVNDSSNQNMRRQFKYRSSRSGRKTWHSGG